LPVPTAEHPHAGTRATGVGKFAGVHIFTFSEIQRAYRPHRRLIERHLSLTQVFVEREKRASLN